ncbi:MAG: signal peptidase I [Flavobacteriales bacterium]|nr:signal peptidase I [Flavobacteriales bacterium]
MNLQQWYLQYKHRKANAKKPETIGEHLIAWVKTIVWALTVVTIVNGLALASFTVPTGSMERTVMAGDYLFVNKAIFGPSTPQIIPFLNIPLPYFKLPAIVNPKQGDVIVFVFPGNRDQVKADNFEYYLKRCVAVAGDTLQLINQKVYVNGKEFTMPEHAQFLTASPAQRLREAEESRYQTFPPGRQFTRDNWGPMRIPAKGDVIKLDQSNILEWSTFIRREGHNVDIGRLLIDGQPATWYTVERDYVFGMGDNRDNSLDSRFWGFIPKESVVGTPMMVYWSWPVESRKTVTVRRPDGMYEIHSVPTSFSEKLAGIRWNRLFTIIH